MVAPLRPVDPFVIPKLEITGAGAPSKPSQTNETSSASFTEKLREVVQNVNELPAQGEQVAKDYADGKQNDLHGTMVSMAQADISLRMIANVRNRAIEAYREIMRMGS
jgi:flagellar hook-basal body complex protein FliE